MTGQVKTDDTPAKFPFKTGAELLAHGMRISDLVMRMPSCPGALRPTSRPVCCTSGSCAVKENASVSGAEVGCQGEVGSACSMAAAGLAEVMGGSPEQLENAAEIAMEQFGSDLRSSWRAHADMKVKYKETSRGGLAVNVIEC